MENRSVDGPADGGSEEVGRREECAAGRPRVERRVESPRIGSMAPSGATGILLSVCIPTYNRYSFLETNLRILEEEFAGIAADRFEVRIYDNSEKPQETERLRNRFPAFLYFANKVNVGSDANIAQCYSQALGDYVMALGDDDYFLPGAIPKLFRLLESRRYGIVYLKMAGHDHDYVGEVPKKRHSVIETEDRERFVRLLGAGMMTISSLVIPRFKLPQLDPSQYEGTNLVQLGVALDALEASALNVVTNDYFISGKRNNTGGYDSDKVFVNNVIKIYGARSRPVEVAGTQAVLFKTLLSRFYPQRLFVDRMQGNMSGERRRFYHERFRRLRNYWLFTAPMLYLPKPLLLIGGPMIIMTSKILNRDGLRAWKFVAGSVWRRLRALGAGGR